MKFSAVTLVTLAAGAIAAPAPVPVAKAAPDAAPGAGGYGSYKGAGEGLKSYPHYGSYGKKPAPKPVSGYGE